LTWYVRGGILGGASESLSEVCMSPQVEMVIE